ncbi:MAG: DTW domain-containing protein [Halobacteriovoraceae bacterium]|nr:DTW domain-containing protein [Halobacteriovoraceae bacterium]
MIHKLLSHFQKHPIKFTRSPRFDLEAGVIECDCAGFITLLLKEMNRMPLPLKNLSMPPKAFQYFNYIRDNGGKSNIKELKRFDVLVWKKENPPENGDTGHLLLLLRKPKKCNDNTYLLSVAEVTKSSKRIVIRDVSVETKTDGTLHRIQWDHNSNKVKETPLLAMSFFESQDCNACGYPEARCLCDILPQKKWSGPQIIILRHPSEDKHPFATVPLIEKSFSNFTIEEGEVFPPRTGTLVYPIEDELGFILKEKEELPTINLPLILIDGTWKKSKRILFQNPWLNELPRLEIRRSQPSNYRIRKQKDDRSYSTLETVAFLWTKLEPKQKEKAEHLLHIFDQFLEKQELFTR